MRRSPNAHLFHLACAWLYYSSVSRRRGPPLTLRAMRPSDWPQVRAIYIEGIATAQATFEVTAPESWDQWVGGRLVVGRTVACDSADQNDLLGWTTLSPVSARSAYAGVAEVTIYVAARVRGLGIGRVLLERLIADAEAAGLWTLQGSIFPENVGSKGYSFYVEPGTEASVTMAGDTSLVLRLSADGHLEANWPVQSALSCRGQAATPDRLQVQADDAPVAVGDELVYRSRHPFNQGSPSLLLPLRGRMLLGGEITEGAGFGSAVNLPILMSARIESRIADRIGQRRLVHAEDIEAGSMVDTHACLSAPAGGVGLSACLRASESEPATGFVRVAAATDESGPMLYAQVSVTGRAVGIRPHAGLERRMMVTRWAGIVTSPWVQILALLVVALGSLCGLLGWTLRDLVQGIAASGGHS